MTFIETKTKKIEYCLCTANSSKQMKIFWKFILYRKCNTNESPGFEFKISIGRCQHVSSTAQGKSRITLEGIEHKRRDLLHKPAQTEHKRKPRVLTRNSKWAVPVTWTWLCTRIRKWMRKIYIKEKKRKKLLEIII